MRWRKRWCILAPRLQNWVSVHSLRSPGISYQLKECLSLHHNRSPFTDVLGCLSHCKAWGFLCESVVLQIWWLAVGFYRTLTQLQGRRNEEAEEWTSGSWNPPFPGFEQSVLLWNLLKSHLLMSFWPPKLFLCKCWHPAEMKSLTWRNTLAYQKLQDSSNILATPVFFFISLFDFLKKLFVVSWQMALWIRLYVTEGTEWFFQFTWTQIPVTYQTGFVFESSLCLWFLYVYSFHVDSFNYKLTRCISRTRTRYVFQLNSGCL